MQLVAFEFGHGRVERALCLGPDVDSSTVNWSPNLRARGRDVLMCARFFQAEARD